MTCIKDVNVLVKDSIKDGIYIGDPCYILPDEIYHGVWEKLYDFKDGKICTKDGKFVMVVGGTCSGDGCYEGHLRIKDAKGDIDSVYFDIPVDAGVIAIVNMEFAKPDWKQDTFLLGNENCYIFKKPVEAISFSDSGGVYDVKFKSGETIFMFDCNTVEDEDEDDYEEEFDYEEVFDDE